jgi:hypothetical protein
MKSFHTTVYLSRDDTSARPPRYVFLSLMVFPKLNSVFYPPLGIGTHTEPKAMTGILVFTILDFYPGVSHILNTSIYH